MEFKIEVVGHETIPEQYNIRGQHDGQDEDGPGGVCLVIVKSLLQEHGEGKGSENVKFLMLPL